MTHTSRVRIALSEDLVTIHDVVSGPFLHIHALATLQFGSAEVMEVD